MAQKRMFTMKICDSDAFLDMPLSTQCLYFHLCMRADDDGFIGNPKRIKSLVGASEDDLKLLIAKRFVLAFEDGVIVIKHWKMHNCIQADRYNPTAYIEEKSMLTTKNNKAYSINVNNMESKCIQNVITDLDLDLDIESDKDIDIDTKKKKEPKHKLGEFGHVRLKEIETTKLKSELGEDIYNKCIKKLDEYIQESGKKYTDHNLTIRRWVIDAVKENKKATTSNKPSNNNNKFNQFPQRGYTEADYSTMEQKLLNKK